MERHRFHSICPYFAMFPETFVRRNIHAWSRSGDLICDPFMGRGTTILESLLNGRKAIGCDTNPVAYCISRAKATPPDLNEVTERLKRLEAQSTLYRADGPETRDEFFALCFHEATLRHLLFLRKRLKWRDDNIDCFIAALTLGCLHGESHRSERYLSNRMPRTISTKPAYSIRWWQQNGCLPPERNAFALLRTLAQYRYESPLPTLKGRVVEGDARRASTLLKSYCERVKLVVTSPPYLDITDYHEDQWLRLWFLGGPIKPITRQGRDDRHRQTETYWQFMGEAWKGIVPLLQDKAQVVIRIGGTRLGQDELQDGLVTSLNASGRTFKLSESRKTTIENGQRRAFLVDGKKASVEHDFRYSLRS
ncbi:MAG: DNA methyltransferase [Vicinamibacterales bacterium]